jgi:hypothetical protein
MIDIEVFEFTTQEETIIAEVLTELTLLTVELLESGVTTDETPNVNVFDIMYHLLEGNEDGRGKAMKFAITGVYEQTGRIELKTNNMNENSINFLEGVLNNQLEFYKKEVPNAFENLVKNNIHLLGKPKDISEVEMPKKEIQERFYLDDKAMIV